MRDLEKEVLVLEKAIDPKDLYVVRVYKTEGDSKQVWIEISEVPDYYDEKTVRHNIKLYLDTEGLAKFMGAIRID